MNDDNPTGEVGPLTEDRSKAPQTALTSPMGNPGLGMNCFTPGEVDPVVRTTGGPG
jgi:hypothetical protein